MLEEHVVTHRINKRPQSFRLANSAFASQHRPCPRECFLANVLDRRSKTKSPTEFEFNQGAEILDEVALCPRVPRAQPLQIQCVKSVEFHFLFCFPSTAPNSRKHPSASYEKNFGNISVLFRTRSFAVALTPKQCAWLSTP